MFEPELAIALEAVRVASLVCRRVQSGIRPDAIEKKDKSPVTVADFASQAVISQMLGSAFPGDPLVGEEDSQDLRNPDAVKTLEAILDALRESSVDATHDDVLRWIDRGGDAGGGSRFWTLDPVDGTKGFLRGEQYAVSLALIIDGELQLAVMGCPNLPSSDAWDKHKGALFSAIRGQGAQLRPLAAPQQVQTVRVSSTKNPTLARFCESVESAHSKQDTAALIAQKLGTTVPGARLDSQAKYGLVARGEADIYLRLPTRADYQEKIWDHGAVLIVQEAGGEVTDIHGRPLDFSRGRTLSQNRGVVATNGLMHAAVLAAVASVIQ